MKKILILTALPLESKVVSTFIDVLKEDNKLPDGTLFANGIAKNCIEAQIYLRECGKGNINSALSTSKLLDHIRPDLTLFIGVAGGIKDLEIGDVIVGEKVYGYEYGKAGDKFCARPNLGKSTYKLIERAKMEAKKDDWMNLVNGNYPGKCQIIIGNIVAGEKVLVSESNELYKHIKENYNDANAIDMEGIGFMEAVYQNNNVSNILIRGISDLLIDKNISTGNNNQETACTHAAAFGFTLIEKFINEFDNEKSAIFYKLKIDSRVPFENRDKLEEILNKLNEIAEPNNHSLILNKISIGSTILHLESDSATFQKLVRLMKSGSLEKLLGYKVEIEIDDELHKIEKATQERKTIWYPMSREWLRDINFVGREAEIMMISEQLKTGHIAAVTEAPGFSTRRMAALVGMGGIGKTKAVSEYAYQYASDYQYIFFVLADTPGNIETGYGEIAKETLNISHGEDDLGVLAQIMIKWMNKNTGWLLILDNVNNAKEVDQYLPRTYKGHILITSRLQILDELGAGNVKLTPLGLLSAKESRKLLARYTNSGMEFNSNEETALQELIRMMGGLPVALEQAATYIRRTHCSFSNYLQLFNSQRTKLFLNSLSKPLEYKGVVFEDGKIDEKVVITTTFHVSFNHVITEANELSGTPRSAAPDLLLVSAFLSPNKIPMKLLADGAGKLGASAAKALRGADVPVINEALQLLYKYSLININKYDSAYSMHRLVQEVVRKWWMTEDERIIWGKRVIEIIDRATNIFQASEGTWTDSLKDQHFASFVAEILMDEWKQEDFEFKEAADLLSQTGFLLTKMRQYMNAENFLERALAIRKKLFGPDHLSVAETLSHFGNMLADNGYNSQALPYYKEAMEIRINKQGSDNPDVAQVYNDYGVAYFNLHKYDKAEKHYQDALRIWQKGRDETLIGSALFNLAMIYKNQSGKKKKAEEYFKEACEKIKTLFMKAHACTEYGNFLVSLDRYSEALPLLQKGREIANGCYPENSELKMKHLDSLIPILRHLGLRDELKKIEGEIKRIRKYWDE